MKIIDNINSLLYDILKTSINPKAKSRIVESAAEVERTPNSAVNPEDVIAWLVTQPNANGTLYLENVMRQYMSALRTAPAKLNIPAELDVRNIFNCHTPDELNTCWNIFRSAPNYRQVTISTSGMFSAGMGCYMRYLQHLSGTGMMAEVADELKEPQREQPPKTEAETTIESRRQVNFGRPELCAQTRPLTCTIKGQAVVPGKQNWSQLLVAITERFIADGNPGLDSLNSKPLYGSKIFFLPARTDFGTCCLLSNGKWIYTNHNPQTVVTIIRNLCQHCGVDLDDVTITYAPKHDAPIGPVQTYLPPTYAAPTSPPKPILDAAVVEQLTNVLSSHFANGYRLNSPIEMTRFRSFAAEDLGEELTLTDMGLKNYIAACGTTFDGKVYAVSARAKEQIKELAKNYFADGAQAIFFAEFYAKHENWLFEASVVSEDMLFEILRRLFPDLSLRGTISDTRTHRSPPYLRVKFSVCRVTTYY